jgi:hypothetical protein
MGRRLALVWHVDVRHDAAGRNDGGCVFGQDAECVSVGGVDDFLGCDGSPWGCYRVDCIIAGNRGNRRRGLDVDLVAAVFDYLTK